MAPDDLAAAHPGGEQRSDWIVFFDESAIDLTPPIRSTWARRGRTPVVRCRVRRRQRVTLAGACCYRTDGQDARTWTVPRTETFTGRMLADLVELLHTQLGGTITLIWDNASTHHSRAIRQLQADRTWLRVVYLPAYAPELNPVEGLWAWLKGRLANHCWHTLEELTSDVQHAIIQATRRPDLARGLLGQTRLQLTP